MTVVVSDTSVLCYLALVGQMDLLKSLFNEVVIPEAVWHECIHPGAPEGLRAAYTAAQNAPGQASMGKLDADRAQLDAAMAQRQTDLIKANAAQAHADAARNDSRHRPSPHSPSTISPASSEATAKEDQLSPSPPPSLSVCQTAWAIHEWPKVFREALLEMGKYPSESSREDSGYSLYGTGLGREAVMRYQ